MPAAVSNEKTAQILPQVGAGNSWEILAELYLHFTMYPPAFQDY